ncbi:MAG: hypothetical protein LC793_24755 [Thermomicrobia bacterium]|nr:hypothetical protein [Thermomicrobia bacterium]
MSGYAPTPYLVMLPFSWLIHDRTLLLFLFSLAVDLARFCLLWLLARRVARDMLTANLVVLTMALMPVGWIVYSWGTFANIFAEGMLTLLFALLALCYGQLAGPNRCRWCAIFAAVICLTLLAHIGVSVLTGLTVMLYLLGRMVMLIVPRRPPSREWGGARIAASCFALAGLVAALVAFALFYRFPAHDLLAGGQVAAIDQEATDTQPAPQPRRYRTGGATPDDRIGLPAVTTTHLSVALAREMWEMSFAFYRVWPVAAALIGLVLLGGDTLRTGETPQNRPYCPEGARKVAKKAQRRMRFFSPSWRPCGRGRPLGSMGSIGGSFPTGSGTSATRNARDVVLTLSVWMTVAAIMLVVGIVARLYVRYPLFALPAVAFGSGVALAWLVRRAWWGRYVAAALLAFSALSTLLMWYDRIMYAFKPVV